MSQPESGGITDVGKVQKSIQFPSDLYELIEDFERRRGAKVNRQALAAFLSFFFSDPTGPETVWMRMAVAIEKGELSVSDVAVRACEDEIANFEDMLKVSKAVRPDGHALGEEAYLQGLRRTKAIWQQMASEGNSPSIRDIINEWNANDATATLHKQIRDETGSKIVATYGNTVIGLDEDKKDLTDGPGAEPHE